MHANEAWKPIPSVPKYEVSTHGRVRHHVSKRVRRPFSLKRGYQQITYRRNGKITRFYAHRAVAEAFLGPILGKVVNHLDRNPRNNRVENLEITSQPQNVAHAMATDPCVGGSWAYEDERLG